MTPEDEKLLDQKKRFAIGLLKAGSREPEDAFRVALPILEGNVGLALEASRTWPSDHVVLAFQAEAITDVGDMEFLPTKAEAARIAIDMAKNEKLTPDERLRALKLYGDFRGFIEKQAPTTLIQNNMTNNKVMLVKDHGSNAEWEAMAAAQQAKLIEDASAPRH